MFGTLAAALSVVGCGKLIGADEYSSADPDLPYHGFFDRLGGTACRQCMLSKCQGALEQCQAEPTCADSLDCVARSPGMLRECPVATSFDAPSAFDALKSCALGCAQECNAGRAWSCNRAYVDPGPLPGVNEAHLSLRYSNQLDGKPLQGLDVRACALADIACTDPRSTATEPTDEHGDVALDVTWAPPSPISPIPGFVGYLELTSKTIEPPWRPVLRVHHKPIVRDFSEWAVMINGGDPKVAIIVTAATGIELDPKLAALSVEAHDCLGASAPDIVFEVTTQPDDLDVKMLYFDATGTPDPTLTRTSSTGIAFGINLKGTSARVIARFASTNDVIREVVVPLRAGASHQVGIPPVAIDE